MAILFAESAEPARAVFTGWGPLRRSDEPDSITWVIPMDHVPGANTFWLELGVRITRQCKECGFPPIGTVTGAVPTQTLWGYSFRILMEDIQCPSS